MLRPPPSYGSIEADIAAALDWWREAGVDAIYSDEPKAWLADIPAEPDSPPIGTKKAHEPAAAPAARIGGPSIHWPQELGAFRQWWLTEPSLDEGGLAPRVAPSGGMGAELMVLVAMPEEADRDTLLSGPQGQVLDSFLKAACLDPQEVYKASALPRHTPLADWAQLERQGIRSILAHHVGLARPKRLLGLGRSILSLSGHDPAQGSHKLRSFKHEGATVPALYEVGLERLLTNWQSRSRLWQRWLEWADGNAWREGSD